MCSVATLALLGCASLSPGVSLYPARLFACMRRFSLQTCMPACTPAWTLIFCVQDYVTVEGNPVEGLYFITAGTVEVFQVRGAL